eukprot:CAMPEP_0176351108 /NCGR_PEP_ID=MMETSP0126-20121128/9980_1 /TAXON_ID=141414 ORGANISM="Strombidinopsis acuminatum, Strain SPMC142" /NCGR_SAMPLE_ID=MMETSP0126 /ASSEMBLY_ACC=CAM_ASM_000229 /LENGTH=271 /DNA_ID=CAMNT_0017701459 /DNA_START=2625 /DNA_END=3440 /DNA_ORIENTATION=+
MSTAINTFYKFIVKKFNIFSEFLYDDLIKNPLMQERRFFNKNKDSLAGEYPYERAEKISKMIKRLGTSSKGLTYMDRFRQLVTAIGNTLGYVRMIRNASLKDNANLIKYLPRALDEIRFEDVANELNIAGETMEAVKMFDMSIRLLFKQADDANDYLRMIVKNFDGIMEQENLAHLRFFYIIIPAMTLNYIDHLQKGKERINKRNNNNIDAFISDDGFPLGVAYLLKILNQTEQFNSLNWFKSMQHKYEKDKQQTMMRVNAPQIKTKTGVG